MTAQYLEFIRQQLIVATVDLSGATKGQLQAWLENAQFETNRYPRKKMKILDEVTGKVITLNNPPIPGKQSMAKGSAIPQIQPVEYVTASWRRALLAMSGHQKAWLMWNYSEDIRWEHQVEITRWAWDEFSQKLTGKRIAKKTVDRLRQLIWLAAQDVKELIAGRDPYQYADLAAMVGVTEKNWSKTYTAHWEAMIGLFLMLDRDALQTLSRSRSQQKSTNLQQGIAKVD